MNYGKKFLYILASALGMYVIISGIAFKTGYFPGHSANSSYVLMIVGAIIPIWGLNKLKRP